MSSERTKRNIAELALPTAHEANMFLLNSGYGRIMLQFAELCKHSRKSFDKDNLSETDYAAMRESEFTMLACAIALLLANLTEPERRKVMEYSLLASAAGDESEKDEELTAALKAELAALEVAKKPAYGDA